MLARLQQAITLGLAAAALLWAAALLALGQAALAVGGALLLLLGHSLVLAAEFTCAALMNRRDAVPAPALRQIVGAWLHESVTAPLVFCWRQPFFSHRHRDLLQSPGGAAARGVLLVHGFVCNRGVWNPWMQRLAALGVPHLAIDLEPVFGSIDGYVDRIDAAVRRLEETTGVAPLIVAHSMGGLAIRAWLASCNADARVHRIITIGTPHRGTALARLAFSANGRQMQRGSAWLRALEAQETAARRALFTCYYSHCDNITIPATCATLAGADNRHVAGAAHVHLALREEVYEAALKALRDPPRPSTARTSLPGPA